MRGEINLEILLKLLDDKEKEECISLFKKQKNDRQGRELLEIKKIILKKQIIIIREIINSVNKESIILKEWIKYLGESFEIVKIQQKLDKKILSFLEREEMNKKKEIEEIIEIFQKCEKKMEKFFEDYNNKTGKNKVRISNDILNNLFKEIKEDLSEKSKEMSISLYNFCESFKEKQKDYFRSLKT